MHSTHGFLDYSQGRSLPRGSVLLGKLTERLRIRARDPLHCVRSFVAEPLGDPHVQVGHVFRHLLCQSEGGELLTKGSRLQGHVLDLCLQHITNDIGNLDEDQRSRLQHRFTT